MKLVRAVVDP